MWIKVYIGLGSNIGEREFYLRDAIQLLSREEGVRKIRISSLYETKPVGYVDQADFLNAVAMFETTKSPEECFEWIQKTERFLGRKREIHWGPRTIDIDLLLYGNAIINSDTLTVPHPRIAERAFVILPMMELDDSLHIPGIGDLKGMIHSLEGKDGVRLWKKKHWLTESGPTEN
jgi:2-amino-4-hydroxy-6-hydroxymethyldihydropteridine diphosphokinase